MPWMTRNSRASSRSVVIEPQVAEKSSAPVANAVASLRHQFAKLWERMERMDRMDQRFENFNVHNTKRKRIIAPVKGDDDKHETEDGPGEVPRLPVYGTVPPVDIRYAYLEVDIRDAALGFTLAPDLLGSLIPPTSPFARPARPGKTFTKIVDDANGVSVVTAVPTPYMVDRVARFMDTIPDITTFLYAWGIFIDLAIHGLKCPSALIHAITALDGYSRWIAKMSVDYTWESICRYHLRVVAKRCIGRFHTSMWYKNIDLDTFLD